MSTCDRMYKCCQPLNKSPTFLWLCCISVRFFQAISFLEYTAGVFTQRGSGFARTPQAMECGLGFTRVVLQHSIIHVRIIGEINNLGAIVLNGSAVCY